MIEDGASCNGEPSECSTGCGDGALDLSTEECDDNNLSSGDGCSAQCQIEAGYDCTVEPLMQSQCFQIGGCGDGIVETVRHAMTATRPLAMGARTARFQKMPFASRLWSVRPVAAVTTPMGTPTERG